MKCWRTMGLALALSLCATAQPAREEVLAAMRKAASFYSGKVATQGGYQAAYAEDLSYGRSEHGEGLTQIEVQRDATPRAGMAFLEAWDATRDRLFLDAARRAALALAAGQLCSGGWDYIVEFDAAKRKQYPYRANGGCTSAVEKPPTTLDDNVTQAAARLMMRVDRELEFQDKAIHDASLFALESLLKAQYPNGSWPQRYSAPPDAAKHPVKRASYPESWPWKWPGANFQGFYTFNDNSIIDVIDVFLEAARIYNDKRYREAANKGGDFLLLAQMPEPQPAWAQQYYAEMRPAWARLFEPPSVTGGESQGILRMLLVLFGETGDKKYLEPVPRALEYLERSVLPPQSNPSEIRKRAGEPALARFYELRTNKPLYVTKGTQIQAKGLGSSRPDGYELSYSDASVITHYAVVVGAAGLKDIRRDYERALKADAAQLRRPTRLRGLSPWSDPQTAARPTAARVDAILKGLDERGAWLQDGNIGKADRAVSVFAAKPMVLTINGRPTTISENDRIELFEGQQLPRSRIIRSTTFAANLEMLAAYLRRDQ